MFRVFWFCFALVFLQPVCHAVDVADVTETCSTWAEEAFYSAEARDNGWHEAVQREMIDVPRRFKAIEDENYWQFRLIIETVFKNPDVPPDGIQQMVMLDCMKRLGAIRPV